LFIFGFAGREVVVYLVAVPGVAVICVFVALKRVDGSRMVPGGGLLHLWAP